MTFTVTYRDKDGALREECVESAGRSECVAALKARGIVPVSVREGKESTRLRSGKSAASPNGRAAVRPSHWVRGAAILAALVLVVGGVWWWAARSASAPDQADGQKSVPSARGDGSGKSAASPKAVAREPGSGKSAASPKEKRPVRTGDAAGECARQGESNAQERG